MLRALQRLLGIFLLMVSIHVMADDIWIDVRTTEEYNSGHIEGAIHIPYEEIASRISEITSDKNATIHLYCRSGRRSGIAEGTLKSLGFTQAINEGGYEDLVKKSAH